MDDTLKTLKFQQQKYRTLPIAVVAATWLISASSAGAVDIESITLGNSNTVETSATKNGVTYRGQSQAIVSFKDENNITWELSGGTTTKLFLRRDPNTASGTVNGRLVVFGRQESLAPANPNIVLPPAPTTTGDVLNQNNIYSGTDNIFSNQGNNNGNNSNVERVDFIFNNNGSGLTATADQGISVFERGFINQHDGFQIAAITSLTNPTTTHPLGLPSGYGKLVTFGLGTWGNFDLTTGHNYTVLNNTKSSTDGTLVTNPNTFRITDGGGVVNQTIGGVVLPLTDLVSANTTIYGYSLFPIDVPANATSSTLVGSYSIANTPESIGGLDLLAANLGVAEAVPVPFNFSPSLGLLLLGATWGTHSLWRRDRIKPITPVRGDRLLS